MLLLGLSIVFPATHPFFSHTINISNDPGYYWKKKNGGKRTGEWCSCTPICTVFI